MASSWGVVGGDPAPGDPAWIDGQATLFGSIADDAEQCARQLKAIYGQWAPSDWRGPAADVFRTHLGLLLPDLQKVGTSYGTASMALRGFASTLAELQASAAQALSCALAAQAQETAAANEAAGAGDSLTAAQQRSAAASSEMTRLTDAIRLREYQLGPSAAGDPTLQSWMASLRTLGDELRAYENQVGEAVAAVEAAEAQGASARQSLANAQSSTDEIRAEYEDAVSRTTATLQEASALGIRNVSFLDAMFQSANASFEHLANGVVKDEQRFARDALLLATGNASGLLDLANWARHDIVAAAPEIHAITHAVARVTDDIANVVDKVAPYVEIGLLVVSLAASVVQPELLAITIPALMAVSKASTVADGVATGADVAEEGSDILMNADGKGALVNQSHDSTELESHAMSLTTDELGGHIIDASGLPSIDDVTSSFAATGEFEPVRLTCAVTADIQFPSVVGSAVTGSGNIVSPLAGTAE